MRSVTIVWLLLILSAPGPAWAAGVFLSVDRDTDELLRLDVDQQTVSVLGVLPFTTTGVELSVLDGRLYAVNSLFPNGVTLYELDPRDASVISSAAVTLQGVGVGHAEGLTRVGEKLLVSFSDVANTNTDNIGVLLITGAIDEVFDLGSGADMDALAADENGALYSFDVSGSSTDRLADVTLNPPSLTTRIAFFGNVTHLSSMIAEGDLVYGTNLQGSSLDTIDLVSESVVAQWEIGRNLVGLTREPGYGVPVPDAQVNVGPTLRPAWPNPFNPRTEIAFELSRPGAVSLEIYALDGRRVRLLHRGRLASGPHTRIWDGLDAAGHEVASGVYFARLRAEDTTRSRKIALVR